MGKLHVLVAHESREMTQEICEALDGEVGHIATVATGEEALSRILRDHPRVLVVDVALSGRAPFELCDDIREAGLRTRVVLVASVYNHTRYKRRPTSLYGADDYVEQHHIHDMLSAKVARFLSDSHHPSGPISHPQGTVAPEAAQRVREAADAMMTIRYDSVEEGRERAARLCELIVADMALYNGEALASIRTIEDAPDQLDEDLQEARRLFARLVPEEIRGDADWVGAQFAELLGRRPRRLFSPSGESA